MHRTRQRSGLAIMTLLALGAGTAARADVHYDFDTGTQGWTVIAGGELSHQASGGNPGGFLQFVDVTFDDMLLQLPTGAGGDWSRYLNGTLAFDARNLNDSVPDWPEFGQLTLLGAGLTLVADVVAVNAPPADGQWHRYTISLSTSVFDANLPTVLANLESLRLKTEYHIGLGERVGIDNLSITAAVPEPGSWALMAAGGVLLLAASRRRSRGG